MQFLCTYSQTIIHYQIWPLRLESQENMSAQKMGVLLMCVSPAALRNSVSSAGTNKLADQQGFTRLPQNGSWHYLESDSRLPDRHAHLLSATGTGQEGKKTQVGHILSLFLRKCLLDGCTMTSASNKGRYLWKKDTRAKGWFCKRLCTSWIAIKYPKADSQK